MLLMKLAVSACRNFLLPTDIQLYVQAYNQLCSYRYQFYCSYVTSHTQDIIFVPLDDYQQGIELDFDRLPITMVAIVKTSQSAVEKAAGMMIS